MQIVTLLGENAGTLARAHIDALAATAEIMVPVADKYAVLRFGETTLVWERHTEFATYTLLRSGDFDAPFAPAHFEPPMAAITADMPGRSCAPPRSRWSRAIRPIRPQTNASPGSRRRRRSCAMSPMARRESCPISACTRMATDGCCCSIAPLSGDEPAQLVLRLQELGNYRNMALLGLPLAQHLTPTVTRLESRLADLTRAVSERISEDDKLLDELTYLSAELARLVAETRYRMSATRAYAQISSDRLASLRIGPVRGHQTLADFTERRLTPAVRTCDSFSARLEDLSQRAAWTSELLRTRIDISLAKQNRDLLASMDRRTHLQLRLQQTVEGLSVVAISYYLVALIGYLLGAVPGLRHDRAMAATVPVVLAIVTMALVRLRRRLHD